MSIVRAGCCAAVVLVGATASWGFEGVLKLRTTAVERTKLSALNGGQPPDQQQTLAITPEQLIAASGTGAQVHESTVYVRGPQVRMNTPTGQSQDGYAIVDIDKNLTWFVLPTEKRYIEWSEADATAMAEKMTQLEKTMKERMGSLPPEQREQVAAMLKNLHGGGDGAPEKPAVTATGAKQVLNGMQTAAYQVKAGDETLVGWVTEEQPELSRMLRTVQQRMEKLTPPAMRGRQSARSAIGDKGFPVRVQTVDPGYYRIEEVFAIDTTPVSADLFTLPTDFVKTTGREAMKGVGEPAPQAE